jgi:hypothetical protein
MEKKSLRISRVVHLSLIEFAGIENLWRFKLNNVLA